MSIRCIAIAAVAIVLGTPPARAGTVVDIEQQGSDVVATGAGTLDLTDLTPLDGTNLAVVGVDATYGFIGMGSRSLAFLSGYQGITGPSTFGSGVTTNASQGSGSKFAMNGSGDGFGGVPALFVPQGYSGGQLSATDTYSNATFASLGLTPGTYTWTWGTGADADFFTVQIGPATSAVPEPSAALMAAVATLSGLSTWAWRRLRTIG